MARQIKRTGYVFKEDKWRKSKMNQTAKPTPEPKLKLLRVVPRACDLGKPACDRWTVVQRIDTGLVVGNIGPKKDGSISFAPDGAQYLLSAKALREIADLIDLHGVELVS